MDEEDEVMVRLVALMAASMSATRGVNANQVIGRAKRYEAYVRGEES